METNGYQKNVGDESLDFKNQQQPFGSHQVTIEANQSHLPFSGSENLIQRLPNNFVNNYLGLTQSPRNSELRSINNQNDRSREHVIINRKPNH